MRVIAGNSCSYKSWIALWQLAQIKPSTLAQIMVPRYKRQNSWIYLLQDWAEHMGRRFGQYSLHFEWAAGALSRFALAGGEIFKMPVGDVADFAGSTFNTFYTGWSWEEANTAGERWHLQLAAQNNEKNFFALHGIAFDQPIDYAPFPDELVTVGKFTISPLRSGADLYAEGKAMHHCVSTYSKDVISGQCRVFSVRNETGQRVATFDLVAPQKISKDSAILMLGNPYLNPAIWRPQQIKGPCNRPVRGEIHKAIVAWFADIICEDLSGALAGQALTSMWPTREVILRRLIGDDEND
jgi:hypothetical protein